MIRRIVLLSVAIAEICCCEMGLAQRLSGPVQEVVDAEMAFARMSKERSTKEAFIENLSAEAIVFSGGEPVSGLDYWKKRPPGNGTIFWWPVFADISFAEDLAYTTGPYQMSKDSESDPYAFGYYSTIWKKNGSGVWKVLMDLGITFEKPEEENVSLKTVRKSSSKGKKPLTSSKEGLTFVEQSYTQWLNETGNSFLPEYFSRECRIHRSGFWPFTSWKVIESIQEDRQFYFEPLNADISQSGDLGYTYGKVRIESRDGNIEKANYMRVWKRENGLNWKIVLDVIG